MHSSHATRAAIIAGVVFSFAFVTAEWNLRQKGFKPLFNDDKFLWADKRPEASKPIHAATVFIGSSRIKYDLDIDTWRSITGEDAVQLALVGTSPVKVLHHLAADSSFRGKVVVDVTEVLFFSQNPMVHKSAADAIKYYDRQTPAEKMSAKLGVGLEAKISLLEEGKFSLTEILNDLQLPNRPGVFAMPAFPKGFQFTTRHRQSYMADFYLKNPDDINRQTKIWKMLVLGDPVPPPTGDTLARLLSEISSGVEKIRARGGRVIFVRTPSSSPMIEEEDARYPRSKYWDQLLAATNSQGIHFKDDPETASLICPEWSHLTVEDARKYTQHLARKLGQLNWFQ